MEYFGTIGPACDREEVLKKMFLAGMTGVRMNMSHTSLAEHRDWVEMLHRAAAETGRPFKLLIDLQGPELRIGKLPGPVELTDGSEVLLGKGVISIPEVILKYAPRGSRLLLDDGKMMLEVLENFGDFLNCEVKRGGTLLSCKSIAVPDAGLRPPTLTEADLQNLALAEECGVSGVMLPFVRDAKDLKNLREALAHAGAGKVQIYAKLENRQGIASLPELVDDADVFVIARGDLGNDMPLWELPAVQKRAAAFLKKAGKPFMVVTQLLDSMERQPVPTRAEVCDIFNAVLDGADAVMLTGETAAGRYPDRAMMYLVKTGEEAVAYLQNIS